MSLLLARFFRIPEVEALLLMTHDEVAAWARDMCICLGGY